MAAGSGVNFTGADINTLVNPYIFAGNSAQGPKSTPLTGTTLDASDDAVSGSTTLGTNSTLALGGCSSTSPLRPARAGDRLLDPLPVYQPD